MNDMIVFNMNCAREHVKYSQVCALVQLVDPVGLSLFIAIIPGNGKLMEKVIRSEFSEELYI